MSKKIYLTTKNISLFVICTLIILIIIIGVTIIISLSIFKSILKNKVKTKGKKLGNTLSDDIIYIMEHQCDEVTEYLSFDSKLTETYMDNMTLNPNNKYHYDPLFAKFTMLLCENVTYTNCLDPDNIILPISFDKKIITILYSKTKYSNNTIIYGYLFYDINSKTTFLIWSGTATARMWISDFNFQLESFPSSVNDNADVKVHEGYLNVYLKFRKQILNAWETIYKDKSSYFVIAGHSLGGALTYISAFDFMLNHKEDIPLIIYTYGSPRVGNTEFVSQYNKLPFYRSIRIFNTEDLIPYIPLPVTQNIMSGQSYLYEHCDFKSVPFTINLGSNVSNHCESYVHYLPK